MANLTILEPMSAGDVIDRTVRLYRRNFAPLVAIVAVPSLVGYATSLLFWLGYAEVFADPDLATGPVQPEALFFLVLGGLGYPVWFFVLLMTVAGLSRMVGDHLMLGEPISFKRCAVAIRRRLGDIILMVLLSVAVMVGLYVVMSMILFVLIMGVALFGGVAGSAGLPPWAVGVVVVLGVLLALGAGIVGLLFILARVVFLPQVLMIEGQSAGSALGRAIRLGAGNWYRVGAILVFTYFVSLSLLAAMALPLLAALYLFGFLTFEFYTSTTWNVLYAAFNQLASLLVLPIWVISFTLLYFDSRVRKEGYDIELLARDIAPGFYWEAPFQPSAFGYQMPVVPGSPASSRTWVQTSPLGLAGYRAPGSKVQVAEGGPPAEQAPHGLASDAEREPLPKEGSAAGQIQQESSPSGGAVTMNYCDMCGSAMEHEARFCIICGEPVHVL